MNLDRSDLPSALQSGDPGERTPFCPDDQTIAACYDTRLAPTQQDRVVQHLAGCAHCRARLGMLARLAERSDVVTVPEAVLARAKQMPAGDRGLRRRWPAAAAAAVAILAVGLVLTLGRYPVQGPAGVEPATERGDAPLRQLRSVEPSGSRPRILNPAEGSQLEPGALEFRWTPVDGAAGYELLLMDDSGNPLLTERLEKTAFRPGGTPGVEPGAHYYLRVTAYLADGRTAGSRHVSFSITAPDGRQE